jgi:hypothetical protein
MAEFEIGLVYQKDRKYYIAVDERTLVSCKDGELVSVRPSSHYASVRSISVEELCEKWEIDLERFDVLMDGFIRPPETELKTRPRGSKRRKNDDEDYWKRHRTGRIVRPSL